MKAEQLQKISQDFFDNSADILSSSVPFSEEIRTLCEQNACGNFGKSWTCPPAVAPLDKLQLKFSSYNRFFIVSKVYTLEDSFDWEGMVASVKNFQDSILKFRDAIKSADPALDCMSLGAGACQMCDTCSYIEKETCRNPEDAVFSVEAFGIDVMKMLSENDMRYNNGKNTVTYVGGILWKDGAL